MRTYIFSCLIVTCAFTCAQSALGGAPPRAPLTGAAREVFAAKATIATKALGVVVDSKDWVVQPNQKGQTHATIDSVVSLTFDHAKNLIHIQNLAALAKRTKNEVPNPAKDFSDEEMIRIGKEIVGKLWSERVFTKANFPGWLSDGERQNILNNSGSVRLESPIPGGKRNFRITFAREDGAWLSATCTVQ